MSEQPRDPTEELIGQMEAAGSLIESLEDDVSQLRRDLEKANAALGAAREEVSARGRALEEKERERGRSSDEISSLRAEMDELKGRHADEQVELRNEHINELAEVRRTLEEQRRIDVAAAPSDERVESLKEELRREREALEERHQADLEALETTSQQWEEQLREGYREQEERHQAEMEQALDGSGKQREELEKRLRAEFEEERNSSSERHEAAMQDLKNAAEGREAELQKNYLAVVESQQAEIKSLRAEVGHAENQSGEVRKEAAREVKKLAESREHELKKAHSAKISAVKEEAGRRVAALQSQKEADNKALAARHAEEMIRKRREHEELLFAEDERRKQETWALEERVSGLRMQREAEMRSYNSRLRGIEAARAAKESAAEEGMARVVAGFGRGISSMEGRISKLGDALEESEGLRARLDGELGELRERLESGKYPSPRRTGRDRREPGSGEGRSLEAKLKEAEAERERAGEELARTREELRKMTDPAQRLRDGISLFNASEHTKAVASISKALGLPKVHAGMDGEAPSKPILTFIWEGMAWRSYVSDPTEGVEEPRVYLSGTGEDTSEVNCSAGPESPNARMDSKGRLTLGVQAR